jgi:hypothetical protein
MSEQTRQQTTFTIPIVPGKYAFFAVTWPMGPDDWAQIMRVLEAMKPGLVQEDTSPGAVAAPGGSARGEEG